MSDAREPAVTALNISAVERETRIGKDTLRVWERRYGFPAPRRDEHGERLYPLEQVDQLRIIRRLLDAGHRPGRVVPMDAEARQQLGAALLDGDRAPARAQPTTDTPAGSATAYPIEALLTLVCAHEPARLRAALNQALWGQGLERFVLGTAVPLLSAVGRAWAGGTLAIYEEHQCSEALDTTLRAALAAAPEPPPGARPRVLLATPQGEAHGLALLMAAALLTVHGCPCIHLGRQTPAGDIVHAARAYGADIVALSHSAARPAPQVTDGVDVLRRLLPPEVLLWVGTPYARALRRVGTGVVALDRLDAIATQVAQWRAAAAA